MLVASLGPEVVRLRLLDSGDRERLRRLFFRLSPSTVYRRFLSPLPGPCDSVLDRLLNLDHCDREAVAAVVDDEIVAVARYARQPGQQAAELALVVADEWQGRGLGRMLLRRLARLARLRGVRVFTGTMLADNRPMLELLRALSPELRARASAGQLEVEIPLRPRP
ncbi:MAG: GNAT family N-acetyltransferase [Candidatus Dormibacteraeota bacterium]|nr:GNAT family N-acetyltransferase [Candidatus Dormibacteraeota bacterium]